MNVVRGKRSVKLREKLRSVKIQSTANLFQGVVPANITLKAVPVGFTAKSYQWTLNESSNVIGTNQTFIIANNQVENVNTYKVVVTATDDSTYEETISIAKVRDGSAIVALKRYMDELITQRQQLNANYNSLYSNPKIGTYRSTLRTAYVDYVAEYNILVNYITAIITQNSFSEAEETTLNNYIANYRLKLIDLVNALETALKLTTDYLDDTITRINEITSFLDTTVNGNVIGTGVLLVGSGTQSNAGISGLNEAGAKSVRLWAGGTAQNRDKANWQILDDGTEVTYHSNGNLATERGLIDGSPVYNFYHKDGYLLFKLDPNRGLVNVAYTQESWTLRKFAKINNNNLNADDSDLRLLVAPLIVLENGFYFIKENKLTYNCYEYFNGTIPSNADLQQYNGYKTNNTEKIGNNIPNGWYILNHGPLFMDSITNKPAVNITFIENGIEKQNKLLIMTNI